MSKILEKINLFLESYNVIDEGKGDDKEYEKFFRGMLKKYGVTEPDQLSPKDKKKFFQEVEDKWTKENPKTNDKDK
jgi:hypothetical protein